MVLFDYRRLADFSAECLPISPPSLLRQFALTLLLSLGIPVVGAGEQASSASIPVEIAVFEYPPLYHTSASGGFSGRVGETIKQICVESGLDCRFQMLPLSRAYMELEKGGVHALITVKFKRFEACCVTSDWRYTWRAGIYSKAPTHSIPSHLSEMNGESLIVVQGWQSPYTYFEDLAGAEQRGELHVHRANSSTAALRMLNRDRAPYLWGGEEFQWYTERMGIKDVNFRPLLEMPMVIWISKDEREVVERFNFGYRRLHTKGLLNKNNVLIESLMTQIYEDP